MNQFIIIPSYNEAKTIGKVIDDVKRYSSNIVVVDDGSTDDTQKAAKDVTILKHLTNMGKGAAMKTGVEYAIKKNAKQIIFIDADGQHEAKEIPHFLDALKDVDVVFGYRELNKKMPLVLKLGNWVINKSIKILYNLELKDTQCGYRAFNTNVYNKIKWKALDYSVESEIIANTGKNKLKYKEIPIKTIYNSRYKGTTVIDGFKIVFNMFLWKIRSI
jgi:glycosyltransferase involved in cell wall biosynthesis|tara:strand:+ start:284 stop:934 length:651 start_codon:yes stop_codon:yes gene_type:complete